MIYYLLIALFCFSGCHHGPKETIKIGIDANWYPLDFGAQAAYVNGFVDDLLQEISKQMQVEFVKIPVSSGNLFLELKEDKYGVALSSLPPYTFNKAKYDFSQNILRIGPVLVMPTNVKTKKLNQFLTLGVLTDVQVLPILQKYPDILVKNFDSTKELLDAVVNQDVQGALLNRIDAVGFTTGIYNGKLKIASLPLDDTGIHFIAIKGKNENLVHSLNDHISSLKKKKFYKDLLEKWKL